MASETPEAEPPEYTLLSQLFPEIADVVRPALTSLLNRLLAHDFITLEGHERLLENLHSKYDKTSMVLLDVLKQIRYDSSRFKDFLNILDEIGHVNLVKKIRDGLREVNENYVVVRGNRHILTAAFKTCISEVSTQLSKRELIDKKTKESVDECDKSNLEKAVMLAQGVEHTILEDSEKLAILLKYLAKKFKSISLGTILSLHDQEVCQGRQDWCTGGDGASSGRKRNRRTSCSDLGSEDKVRDHVGRRGMELSGDDFKRVAHQTLMNKIDESKNIKRKKMKTVVSTVYSFEERIKEEVMRQMRELESEFGKTRGEQDISALKGEIEQLNEQKRALEVEKFDLLHQRENLNLEIAKLEEKNSEVMKKLADKENENAFIRNDLKAEIDKNEKEIKELKQKLEEVKGKLTKAEYELDKYELKIKVRELEVEKDTVKKNQKELKRIRKDHKKELEKIRTEHKGELAEVRSKYDEKIAGMNREHKKELKSELAELRREQQIELSRRNETERCMKEEISGRIEGMEQRLDQLEKE